MSARVDNLTLFSHNLIKPNMCTSVQLSPFISDNTFNNIHEEVQLNSFNIV